MSLRNKNKGQTLFVINNDPIVSNKIYLAFDQTPCRPDSFTIKDDLVSNKIKKDIHNNIKIVHIISKLDSKGSNKNEVVL